MCGLAKYTECLQMFHCTLKIVSIEHIGTNKCLVPGMVI